MARLGTRSRRSLATVASLVLILISCAYVIVQEIEVRDWAKALHRQQLAIARGEPPPPVGLREPSSSSPRALVQAAMLKANLANSHESPQREALLGQARQYLDRARAKRPLWGEAEIVAAYIASLEGPGKSDELDRALALSYQYAPYLRGSAPFRIRLGLERWNALPDRVRERLIDEAVWYARLDRDTRETMFELIRRTGAYRSFFRRWLEVRAQDRDWGSSREPRADQQ